MKTPTDTIRSLLATFAVLLGLLAVTAGAKFLPGGWWSTPISLSVAIAKAALIFCYFMRLRHQPGLVRIFAVAGLFWLAILVVLTLSDFLTRTWSV